MSNITFPRAAFVGFDHLLNELNSITKHANDTYPPFNIVKSGEYDYLIELAVARFKESELEVTVKDRNLTISGNHESSGREFIHKGISTKKFSRSFRLSEHVEVVGAKLENGILAINLKYVIPEQLQPKTITIQSGNSTVSAIAAS